MSLLSRLEAAFGPVFTRPLFLHAHPDDEVLQAGGLTAALAAAGRAPLVLTATRGEQGEARPGTLPPDFTPAQLVELRTQESTRARAILRVGAFCFLGVHPARATAAPRRYEDSGMTWVRPGVAGPAPHASPAAFTRGPLAEEIADAAAFASAVGATVLIGYDAGGSYGHPDHVRAHAVAEGAAQRAGIPFIQIVSGGDVPPAPGEGRTEAGVVVETPERREAVIAALNCYGSQLEVVNDAYIRHVGGNTQALPLRVVLK